MRLAFAPASALNAPMVRRRGFFVLVGCAACVAPRRAHAAGRRGGDLEAAADDMRALAREARRLAPAERIAFVNQEINRRIAYCPDGPDAETGDAFDHWSTPCETLARGRGDCEDFAIAKHFLLDASGVPAHLHRLLYAHWRPRDGGGALQAHLTAVARDPRFDDPWVLDQMTDSLLALSAREDLDPLFSFDAHSMWYRVEAVALPRGPLRAAAWRGVLERTRAQPH